MSDPRDVGAAARAIDQGLFLDVNGLPQWVTLRGKDLANPPLMIVGGPGAAFTSWAPFFAPWEAAFTLVQWDQPGGGATWARNGDATGPISLERLVHDGLDVAGLALARLGGERLILLGSSGGSIVGLQMIRRRPELFCAYVGTGQFVDWARQDALGYALVLGEARAAADDEGVAELERIGPPPYPDIATDAIKSRFAGAFTAAEQAALAAAGQDREASLSPPADAPYLPRGMALPDPRSRGMAAYEAVRDELMAFDARRLGLAFQVPLVFLQGDLDLYSVTSEVETYAREVRAPAVRVKLIEGGGHSALLMREAFLAALVSEVRPLATGWAPARRPGPGPRVRPAPDR
jgi:pimeloyl-ACP methyl ester carboxylesterase